MTSGDEQRVRELGLREAFGSCDGRGWDGVLVVAAVRDGVDRDGRDGGDWQAQPSIELSLLKQWRWLR